VAHVSHRRDDLADHPDAMEMRTRYSRVMGGRDVPLVDGPVFLAGLYCAISPWVVDFLGTQPALVTHNLVVGTAIALLALGFTMVPERMYGLSGAMSAIGAWLVISPWVVATGADAGIIWNQVIVGGVVFLLGVVCAGLVMKSKREGAARAT
jgi:hypothetical protein